MSKEVNELLEVNAKLAHDLADSLRSESQLAARIAELEAALKPFANVHWWQYDGFASTQIQGVKADDFQRARDALPSTDAPPAHEEKP